ncbi:glycerol-3-phosphate 1-O-acyltransferase PlsY [bacterium]|nr:glycerol-3-phosphate 1-O-acyltransferase PlsY [bacterium]
MNNILYILIGYFLGSIPTGYIVNRLIKGVDIRKIGSGNVGATNTYRVSGRLPALIVFLVDAAKGILAVLIVRYMLNEISSVWLMTTGVCSVLGHIFPAWLHFKGGKGVSTAAGIAFIFMPDTALAGFLIFLVVFLLTKTVSLSSITAFFSLLIFEMERFIIVKTEEKLFFAAILFIIILSSHRTNIKRILAGKELSFRRGKK